MSKKDRNSQLWLLAVRFIAEHPNDLSRVLSRESGLTRQSISGYINRWLEEGLIEKTGNHRKPEYRLLQIKKHFSIDLTIKQSEDTIFSNTVKPYLKDFKELKPNVYDICNYSFTEIVNNAIDHSQGTELKIHFERNQQTIKFYLIDNGEGIFKRIQRLEGLTDPKQALLKLSSGKFTTDKTKHTGQGIFFTSRACDQFSILSDQIIFDHADSEPDDWIAETKNRHQGTTVILEIECDTKRTLKELFDQYADDEDYSFNKTVLPLRMALHAGQLISRSEAKRIGAQLIGFKQVILDFTDVDFIGQAFADELFRVFQNQHPEISMTPLFTNEAVSKMIQKALLDTTPKDPFA